MKKVMLFMALILPFTILAQTRPAPSKMERPEPSEMRVKPVENQGIYAYLIMNVIENKGTKKGDKTTYEYKFETNDQRTATAFEKMTSRFQRTIDIINAIGMRGWELAAVEGGTYYFKMKVHKPERVRK
jgi:hypothetical protein